MINSRLRIYLSWNSLPSPRIPPSPGGMCIFPTRHLSKGKYLGMTGCQHLFPHCQTPPRILLPDWKSAGRDVEWILFGGLTWVHAQEHSQQEHKESLHLGITCFGAASLGSFLLGQVIYPGRPGVPTRSSLRRHLRELLAAPREGLPCVLGYLCLVPLLFPCQPLGSPQPPCLPSYPWAKCSQEWKKPQILPNKAGLMHFFFRATEAAVAPRERGSPPTVPPWVEPLCWNWGQNVLWINSSGYLSACVSDTPDNKVCGREVCGQFKSALAFPGIEEFICHNLHLFSIKKQWPTLYFWRLKPKGLCAGIIWCFEMFHLWLGSCLA